MDKYLWAGHRNAHRVTMEKHIGRKLSYNEVVHHKNGNKSDNNIENLEILSRAEHASIHHKKAVTVMLECLQCGKKFERLERVYRRNLKDGTEIYCSKSCLGKAKLPSQSNRIPEEIREEMYRRYDKGDTCYKISKDLKLCKESVYYIIKRRKL